MSKKGILHKSLIDIHRDTYINGKKVTKEFMKEPDCSWFKANTTQQNQTQSEFDNIYMKYYRSKKQTKYSQMANNLHRSYQDCWKNLNPNIHLKTGRTEKIKKTTSGLLDQSMEQACSQFKPLEPSKTVNNRLSYDPFSAVDKLETGSVYNSGLSLRKNSFQANEPRGMPIIDQMRAPQKHRTNLLAIPKLDTSKIFSRNYGSCRSINHNIRDLEV